MKRIALLFALLTSGLSVSAVDFYADFSWVFGKLTWVEKPEDAPVITPQQTTGRNGDTLVFTANLPDGGEVKWWSHGAYSEEASLRFKDVREKTYNPANNTVGNLPSNFTYTVDINTPAAYSVGVVIDYFPFAIEFNPGDGSGPSMAKVENVFYTNKVTLAACTFSLTGHSFAGWSLERGGDIVCGDGATVDGADLRVRQNRTVRLYAVWTPNTYTVKFDARDGSQPETFPSCEYGTAYKFPTPKPRTGYDFVGWTKDAKDDSNVLGEFKNLVTEPDGEITLYAVWKAHLVDFKYVLGDRASLGEGSPNVAAYGTAVKIPVPSRPGYAFAGWKVSGDLGNEAEWGASPKAGTPLQRDVPVANGALGDIYLLNLNTENEKHITLTAVWTAAAYLLEYDFAGGTANADMKYPAVGQQGQVIEISAPTKPGYSFAGWFVREQPIGAGPQFSNLGEKYGSPVRLTATWVTGKYLASFNTYGANNDPDRNAEVTFGEKPEKSLTTPVWDDGYKFGGYWSEPDGRGTMYWDAEGQPVRVWDIPGDATLHALKRGYEYELAFEVGEGHPQPSAMTCTNGIAVTLPRADEVTWAGHVLAGWATEGGKVTSPGAAFNGSAFTIDAPGKRFTLYAQWSTNGYQVAFFGNGGTNETGDVRLQPFAYGVAQDLVSNTFVRAGYAFKGWDYDPANSGAVDFTDGAKDVNNLTEEPDGLVRLYARWEAIGGEEVTSELSKWIGCGLNLITPSNDGDELWTMVVLNDVNCLAAVADEATESKYEGKVCKGWSVCARAVCDGVLSCHAWAQIKEGPYPFRFELSIDGKPCTTTDSTGEVAVKDIVVIAGQKVEWRFMPPNAQISWPTDPRNSIHIDRIDWVPDPVIGGVGLTFRRNDGTASPDDIETNLTCVAGAAIGDRLPVPAFDENEREFLGWHTNAACVGEAIDREWIVPNVSNVELFAKWDLVGVRVKFMLNDGTARVWREKAYRYGQTYRAPEAPTRSGFRFLGWFTEAEGGGELTADWAFEPADDGRAFYAHWEAGAEPPPVTGKVRVAFWLNNGSEDKWAESEFTLNEPYANGAWPKADPRWGDRKFLGWFTAQAGGDGVVAGDIAVEGVNGLYARWGDPGSAEPIVEPETEAVEFRWNDGSDRVWATVYCHLGKVYDGSAPWPAGPDRPLYDFSGWWSAPEGGEQATDASVISQAVYYAHWLKARTNLADGGEMTLAKSKWDYLDGDPVEPSVVAVTLDGRTLRPDDDYTVSYADNREVGTSAKAIVTGVGDYSGALTNFFEIVYNTDPYDMSGVQFSNQRFVYDGEAHSLAVTGELPLGVKVAYEGNGQTEVGTYTVKALFTGASYKPAIPAMEAKLRIAAAGTDEPSFISTNVAMVGRHFLASLKDLGLAQSEFDKRTTVKADVLPKGLKLVKATNVNSIFWSVEGVPTETWAGEGQQVAFLRIADSAKNVRVVALSLKVVAENILELPSGKVKTAYGNFCLADWWPDMAENPKNWSVKGLPSGMKFATKAVASSGRVVAEAYELYGTPSKAGRYLIKVTQKKADGSTYSNVRQVRLTVLNADGSEPIVIEKPVPGFALEDDGVVFEDGIGRLRQGVLCNFAVTNTSGSKVVASGLPTGVKLVSVAVKEGSKTVGTRYWLDGAPTKPGYFTPIFTTTLNGVAVRHAVAFRVLDLPAWARGTFNGLVRFPKQGAAPVGAAASFTMTVANAGKLSGKIHCLGTNWTFSVAGYATETPAVGAEDGSFEVVVSAKASKVTCPLTMTVARVETPVVTNAAAGVGVFGVGDVFAQRAFGKDKDAMAVACAKSFEGLYTVALPADAEDRWGAGYLSLKVDKSGGVKVAGKAADGTSLSCSATLGFAQGVDTPLAAAYVAPSAYKGGMFAGEFAIAPAAAVTFVEPGFVWASRNPQATGIYGEGFIRLLQPEGGWYDKNASLRVLYGDLTSRLLTPTLEVKGLAEPVAPQVLSDEGKVLVTVNAKDTGYDAPKATKPAKDQSGSWIYEGANDAALKFSLTKSTGVFKGSYLGWYDYADAKGKAQHVSKSYSFEGLAVQGAETLEGFVLVSRTAAYVDGKTGREKTYTWKESIPVRFVTEADD